MSETGAGAANRYCGDIAEFRGCIGFTNRELTVSCGKSRNQRGHEDPKYSQRQGIANEIDGKRTQFR